MALGIHALVWQHVSWDALRVQQLYDLLQLRSAVFVVEQNCVFQDIDGYDAQAMHVLGYQDDKLVAYARCFTANVKYAEASIGRVITSAALRGQGAGPALVQQAIDCIEQQWGKQAIRIGAQAHLSQFYGQLGFAQASEIYSEDNIAHIEMVRSAVDI
jgi:ElaA protein